MSAQTRATLVAFFTTRGLAGMTPGEINDLFDSIVFGGGTSLSTIDLDLGLSGTAGSLDIFPTTASKGKVAITKSDNTNNDTTSLVIAGQAAAQTMTIPDPMASADFLMGKQAAVARTATAAGATTGTIADGGCVQKITVTCDDANKIIILPTPTPGTLIILSNGATGYELRSSTPASIAINGGSGANAESAIAASSVCFVYCVSSTDWRGYFMDADGDVAKIEAAAT